MWVRGIWNAVDPRDGHGLGGVGMRRGQDAGMMASDRQMMRGRVGDGQARV